MRCVVPKMGVTFLCERIGLKKGKGEMVEQRAKSPNKAAPSPAADGGAGQGGGGAGAGLLPAWYWVSA